MKEEQVAFALLNNSSSLEELFCQLLGFHV